MYVQKANYVTNLVVPRIASLNVIQEFVEQYDNQGLSSLIKTVSCNNFTSRVHFPLGYSAQVCDVMKGHFVNPS